MVRDIFKRVRVSIGIKPQRLSRAAIADVRQGADRPVCFAGRSRALAGARRGRR